jgi:hypothetical protein
MRSTGACVCAVVVALGSSLLASAELRAESKPDTSYCWPTVVARGAHGRPPVSGSVQLYRIEESGSDSVRWVEEASFPTTLMVGRAEVVGVLAGRYLVNLRGVYGERPLANWQPPPGHPTEVQVGWDPWKRPVQRQSFEAWIEWNVVHGNCADSIMVRVKPGEWFTPTGEKRINTGRPVMPTPYRLDEGTHRRSGDSKP